MSSSPPPPSNGPAQDAPSTPRAAHEHLEESFCTHITQSIPFRLSQLQALKTFLQETEEEHLKAIYSDLHKTRLEALMYDIHPLTHDIHHFLKHLKTLARPKSLPRSYGAQAYIQSIPKGKVLIFGPFNFPTSLIIRPLIAALAAGNVCCLKPSELTPASEAFLSKLLQYLDPRVVSIVTGGADTCEELLKLKWDHIMFTGSAEIGRIVMAAASKHLTPVTLELGGKCPALITQSADINTAVMGVLRARFGNCGQFCLAADYCLVDDSVYDEFVKVLLETITLFFTDDPLTCPHLGRPVSARHHARITRLISETKGDILVGGVPTSAQHEEDSLFLAPTIVALTSTEDVLMSEEIFGPVLPLIRSKSTSESIKYVNNHEIPLALYAFSCDNCEVDDILTKTRSGSIAINDTVLQVAVPGSFLGGLGESGMGAYGYGRGFVEFSHERPVLWSTPFWSRFGNLINPHVMGRAPGWLERGIRFLGKIPAARGREHESSLIAE